MEFISKVSKRIQTLPYRHHKNTLSIFYMDMKNRMKYGRSAPVIAERIWVDPLECKKALHGRHINSQIRQASGSGCVVESDWPEHKAVPVSDIKKIQFCIDHWVKGISWSETGIFKYLEDIIAVNGKADRCRNREDIVKRYNNLDHVFNQIKKEGRFRTKKELNKKNFRERGGALFHIGPEGEIFFSFKGCHRFAIAYVLKLRIPAQLGYVHIDALPFLSKYRDNRIT